eukprot:358928_1
MLVQCMHDIIQSIIWFIDGTLMTCLFCIFVIKTIKSVNSVSDQPKCLFYTGITYFILIIVTCFTYSIWQAFACLDDAHAPMWSIVGALLSAEYGIQYFLLILILFIRQNIIFDATSYENTKYTIITFYTLYVSVVVFGSVSVIISATDLFYTLWYTCLISIAFILGIVLLLFLTVPMVTKLIQIHKQMRANINDKTLLRVATKNTVLTVATIVSAIVVVIVFSLESEMEGRHGMIYTITVFTSMDLWTNYLCILYGYKQFDRYYYKCCGCCDVQCTQCLMRNVAKDETTLVISIEVANTAHVCVSSENSPASVTEKEFPEI